MPSNSELRGQAEKIAVDLGIEISTKGLTNNELVALVSDLKAKQKDAENPAAEEAQAAAVAEDTRAPYSVAKGKAITSKRGILSEGDEVKASYFVGGKETLNALVDHGYVVKA